MVFAGPLSARGGEQIVTGEIVTGEEVELIQLVNHSIHSQFY